MFSLASEATSKIFPGGHLKDGKRTIAGVITRKLSYFSSIREVTF
jgi:hypothetical protein